MVPYESPEYKKKAFNCPHCGAYADQHWFNALRMEPTRGDVGIPGLEIVICQHCQSYAIWHKERMLYPETGSVPPPNPDLPDSVREDYEEARGIVNKSPRGAAALLRLAIQKLCGELGEKDKDLNNAIRNLVKRGLLPKVQEALDAVRVIGNNAVHPGKIDLRDDPDTANRLFVLVNLIADRMFTHPKLVDEMYSGLPEGTKQAIARRDS